MTTSREGKREKTMIETRRGREREAEEEAEVRKQEERKEAKVEEIMRES